MWFWQKRSREVERVRRELEEGNPGGPAQEKLHGLIKCVRWRLKSGYEQEEIADRARLPHPKVREIVKGRFVSVKWDSIEAVLRVMGASQAEISVALDLYNEMSLTLTPPPHRAESEEESTTSEPPEPTSTKTTLPLPVTDLIEDTSTTSDKEQTNKSEEQANQSQEDAVDTGVKFDPMRATTVQEFTTCLEAFRASKGDKSFAHMAKHCADLNKELRDHGMDVITRYSAASFCTLIKEGKEEGKLGKQQRVLAFVAGAGGQRQDIELWANAWTRMTMIDKTGGDSA
ncbi:hypothetical protein [Actinomadura sp. 6N118]|uniref:hypothetical protein n=1 Tax=Actinomadura sp. 6N118 TaxID=3375151 RepID=UPI00379A56B3